MIKVICIGKIKEEYLRDAIKEYQKRLSKYIKLEIIELNDINNENTQIVLNKEKEEIIRYINKSDYIICLDIDGKEIASVDFSKKIDKIFTINPNITFLIGGSYGIHQDIKNLANERISFSKLTFPHQLFRVMLLEQIYRSFKIMNNETYHK